MNFAGGIFGIDGALEAAASRRAKGTAERLYATKRTTKRAEPFRVERIEAFLSMLFEDSVHLHDRCVAVFVLMLVSLRARSSDAHRIAKFIIMLAQPSVVVSSSAVHSDLRTPTPNKGRALCYPWWVLVN